MAKSLLAKQAQTRRVGTAHHWILEAKSLFAKAQQIQTGGSRSRAMPFRVFKQQGADLLNIFCAYQPFLNELGFVHAPDDNKDGCASSALNWENCPF